MGVKIRNPRFANWLDFAVWTEAELIQLCAGHDPHGGNDELAAKRFDDAIRKGIDQKVVRAVEAGILPVISGDIGPTSEALSCRFRSVDAIKWAAPIFPDFPFDYCDVKAVSNGGFSYDLQLRVGYADFVRICQITDDDWFPGHVLRADGVYVELPTGHLMPEERASLAHHSTGNLLEPTLRFPCTVAEMRAYIAVLDDFVVEENFESWLAHNTVKQETAILKATTPKSVVMISEQQENLILEALIAEGYTPTALPRWKNNEAGAKAKIRSNLQINQPKIFRSNKIFDKAWERLSVSGRIAYAPDGIPQSRG